MTNFECTCRCCASILDNDQLFEIFMPIYANSTLQIAEIFGLCTDLEALENDRLPQQICIKCLNDLKLAYDFRKSCHNSQDLFNARLKKGSMKKQERTPPSTPSTIDDLVYEVNYLTPIKMEFKAEDSQQGSKFDEENECFETEYLDNESDIIEYTKDVESNCTDEKDYIFKNFLAKLAVQTGNKDSKQIPSQSHQLHELELMVDYPESEEDYADFQEIESDEDEYQLSIVEVEKEFKKGFTCDICDKTYTQKSTLKSHMLVHTGQNPFKCQTCGKQFRQSSTLRTHMSLHTGKTHLCTICGKRYSTRGELAVHFRNHTGEKPYKCSECPASFTMKSYLNEHFVKHKNTKEEKCNVCGLILKRKSSLRMHMYKHKEANPFSCPLCSKSFVQKYLLKRHLEKIHKVLIDTSNIRKYVPIELATILDD